MQYRIVQGGIKMKDRHGFEIKGYMIFCIWCAVVGTPFMLAMILSGLGTWIQYLGILANSYILWNNWGYVKKKFKDFLYTT